ncbi:MAG: hypothetical protein H5T92_05915, partial [Synergistales bacterium]|nr:hypothetical protein [Synergistales bacterium]
MERARVLYLYTYLAEAGFEHIHCRRLVEALEERYDVTLRYGIVPDDTYARLQSPSLKTQLMPESQFLGLQYDVLFIEHRLGVSSAEESEKARSWVIRHFRDLGGVVVFNFGEVNGLGDLARYNEFLRRAGLPRIWQPRSADDFQWAYLVHALESVFVRGYDDRNAVRQDPNTFRVNVDDRYLELIAYPIRPAFTGVREVVLNCPLHLEALPGRTILTGNPGVTRLLGSNDLWCDGVAWPDFGAYDESGQGCSVIITGSICSDRVLEEAPHDGVKLVCNLLEVLLELQRERRAFFLGMAFRNVKQRWAPKVAAAQDKGVADPLWDRIANRLLAALESTSIPPRYREDAMEFLSATLSRCWADLEDESRQFLMTGESVFRLFRASGAPDLDYAAVALPFAKSLEVELNTKLLRRFREYLRAQGNLDAAVAEAHSRRICLALEPSTRSRGALTLGEFARELGQMIHG